MAKRTFNRMYEGIELSSMKEDLPRLSKTQKRRGRIGLKKQMLQAISRNSKIPGLTPSYNQRESDRREGSPMSARPAIATVIPSPTVRRTVVFDGALSSVRCTFESAAIGSESSMLSKGENENFLHMEYKLDCENGEDLKAEQYVELSTADVDTLSSALSPCPTDTTGNECSTYFATVDSIGTTEDSSLQGNIFKTVGLMKKNDIEFSESAVRNSAGNIIEDSSRTDAGTHSCGQNDHHKSDVNKLQCLNFAALQIPASDELLESLDSSEAPIENVQLGNFLPTEENTDEERHRGEKTSQEVNLSGATLFCAQNCRFHQISFFQDFGGLLPNDGTTSHDASKVVRFGHDYTSRIDLLSSVEAGIAEKGPQGHLEGLTWFCNEDLPSQTCDINRTGYDHTLRYFKNNSFGYHKSATEISYRSNPKCDRLKDHLNGYSGEFSEYNDGAGIQQLVDVFSRQSIHQRANTSSSGGTGACDGFESIQKRTPPVMYKPFQREESEILHPEISTSATVSSISPYTANLRKVQPITTGIDGNYETTISMCSVNSPDNQNNVDKKVSHICAADGQLNSDPMKPESGWGDLSFVPGLQKFKESSTLTPFETGVFDDQLSMKGGNTNNNTFLDEGYENCGSNEQIASQFNAASTKSSVPIEGSALGMNGSTDRWNGHETNPFSPISSSNTGISQYQYTLLYEQSNQKHTGFPQKQITYNQSNGNRVTQGIIKIMRPDKLSFEYNQNMEQINESAFEDWSVDRNQKRPNSCIQTSLQCASYVPQDEGTYRSSKYETSQENVSNVDLRHLHSAHLLKPLSGYFLEKGGIDPQTDWLHHDAPGFVQSIGYGSIQQGNSGNVEKRVELNSAGELSLTGRHNNYQCSPAALTIHEGEMHDEFHTLEHNVAQKSHFWNAITDEKFLQLVRRQVLQQCSDQDHLDCSIVNQAERDVFNTGSSQPISANSLITQTSGLSISETGYNKNYIYQQEFIGNVHSAPIQKGGYIPSQYWDGYGVSEASVEQGTFHYSQPSSLQFNEFKGDLG